MTRLLQAAFIGLAAFAVAQDNTVVRKELKEGTVDRYTIQFTSNHTANTQQMGDVQFNIDGSMDCAITIGKYDADKKTAALGVTMTNMKFELGGQATTLQPGIDALPKEIPFTGKIDDHSRITDFQADAKLAQASAMLKMVSGAWEPFLAFPDQAVKPGDVWDLQIPKYPEYGDKEFTVKAKFTEEKVVDGVPALMLAVDGTLPLDMDMSSFIGAGGGPAAAAGQGARMSGPMDMHMEYTVEKATGRLIRLTFKASGKVKLDMPAVSMSMDIDSDETTTVKPQTATTATPTTPPSGQGG
jgi:hypothetical protein